MCDALFIKVSDLLIGICGGRVREARHLWSIYVLSSFGRVQMGCVYNISISILLFESEVTASPASQHA